MHRSSQITLEMLVAEFKSLRNKFQPVMRHFFTEKQRVPMSWFTMRLNYTRSVASSSIIGHVLGLGDRHTSNILMDNKTGEVVHIDLGIAFDQVCCAPCWGKSYSIEHGSGQTAWRTRASAVPVDEGHGGRDGVLWHAGRLSALCGRNASGA